jgi:hypothetical protein
VLPANADNPAGGLLPDRTHNKRRVEFITRPSFQFIDEIKNARPWKTGRKTVFVIEEVHVESAVEL